MNAKRFSVLFSCVTLGGFLACLPVTASDRRPNILWITCEDTSLILGCYGDPCAVTPSLDRLARQGVRYTNAFAVASVCSPSRSCLITGVYPTSLGTQHLRSTLPVPKQIRCFPEYLREAGYYCTNNVKEDYNFKTPKGCWDESSRQAHWRKRKPHQPFFSVFNFTTTHQSQFRLPDEQFAKRIARLGPQERHDPAEILVPPYYPDTPVVRRDLARVYDLVTAMDKQAGDLLAQLEEDGLAEETIVFFFSDHGTGMPRHKRTLYDSGIHVPLMVRFPKEYRHLAVGEPGTTTDRLVSFVDFAPTVLSLAGVKIPDHMQGRAFLGEQAAEPRTYVFAVRDRVDEVYEVTRAVRDKRYKYIRHYMPHRPLMQLSYYSEQTPTRQEWRRLAAEGKLAGPESLFLRSTRPPEELFDTRNDPNELRNLAHSPDHQEILTRMRDVHRAWTIHTHDTGLLPEAEMYRRSGGLTPYEMARRADLFPVQRILKAADLVGRGPGVRDELEALLGDSDAAIRYWAAVGLAALGPDARPASGALRQVLSDPSPNVRLAAAEALCNLGREAEALPVLVEGLQHDDGWVRLHAAIALQYIGDRARAVLPQINAAMQDERKHQAATYTRWALSRVTDDRPK